MKEKIMRNKTADTESKRPCERSHWVEVDSNTGHYYPDRVRMNPPEDMLDDVEIWVYNESKNEDADKSVEPHFHVCKGWVEDAGANLYEIDIEVKIRNIDQLNIGQSITGNTSWEGLDELYNAIKKWLNEDAYDADIKNKEAIRQEWSRHNMSNRVSKDEL